MKRETYERRLQAVQSRMEERGIDCFLAGPSSTMRYLTGYGARADERLLVLVMAAGKAPFILANKLYALQLQGAPVDDFVFWGDGEDAVGLLMKSLAERGIAPKKVAVDKMLPGMFLVPISERLQGASLCLANELTDPLRVYKDEEEMEAMATACKLASNALRETISDGTKWIGKTELEFLGRLNLEMARQGLEAPSGLVAVGAHAAEPHHLPDQTVIEEGKCLLVDFGGAFGGYRSDMTRTFHFGEPSEEFRKVYAIVLEANRLGRQAAGTAGNLLQDVDRAARGYIASQGYGEFFTHRTGHGIGIDGHEGPAAGEGVTVPITKGMAFSVEPGIYLPGRFGVRIEDQVLITGEGLKILHDFDRELMVIG